MKKKYRAQRMTELVDGVTVSDKIVLLKQVYEEYCESKAIMTIDIGDIQEVIEALQNAQAPF